MRLAAVVLEEHAGRAVELRDDDALGAVDDERAVVGHERNLAHVDLLLLHFLDGVLRRFLVHDDRGAPWRAAPSSTSGRAAGTRRRRTRARSSEKLTNSRRALPEWLEIGKIDVNAACRPSFLRASLGVPSCRNARYDASCVSSRNGTGEDARALGEALPDAFLFGKGVGRSGGGRHSVSRLRFVEAARSRADLACTWSSRAARYSTVRERCIPRLVAGHYQPLADNVAIAATSDQTCLPQSTQKAKRRRLEQNQLRFDPEGIEAGRQRSHRPLLLLNPEIVGLRPRFPF